MLLFLAWLVGPQRAQGRGGADLDRTGLNHGRVWGLLRGKAGRADSGREGVSEDEIMFFVIIIVHLC